MAERFLNAGKAHIDQNGISVPVNYLINFWFLTLFAFVFDS